MKLFRFMSKKEFEKLINGEKLINKKKHKGRTGSTGFCFMQYNKDCDINYSYEYLSGIVDDDIIVVFETDKKNVNESWGVYADPYGSFFDTITETEYCTKEYDKKIFKIIKYGVNSKEYSLDIKWCNNSEEALNLINKKIKLKKEKQKEIEKKCNCVEEIKVEKAQELNEFIESMRTCDKDLQFKINDKYYKVNGNLVEIEGDMDSIRLNFDVYLRR